MGSLNDEQALEESLAEIPNLKGLLEDLEDNMDKGTVLNILNMPGKQCPSHLYGDELKKMERCSAGEVVTEGYCLYCWKHCLEKSLAFNDLPGDQLGEPNSLVDYWNERLEWWLSRSIPSLERTKMIEFCKEKVHFLSKGKNDACI